MKQVQRKREKYQSWSLERNQVVASDQEVKLTYIPVSNGREKRPAWFLFPAVT